MEKIKNDELNTVNGGNDGFTNPNWRTAFCCVESGYLAIRSYASYDDSNELASINQGEVFSVDTSRWSGSYVWANYNGIQGWVNADFCTILN